MRLICVLFLMTTLAYGPTDANQPVLKVGQKQFSRHIHRHVNRLIKKHRINRSNFAFVIKNLSTNHLEYELNAESRKIPASLTKILVAGACLDTFSPEHTFKTQLFINGPVKDGTLQGPLYLKGFGDPSFTSERMWYLVNEFLREGIRQINGDILVDDTLFDPIRRSSGRLPTQTDRAYDAPIGALSFNWNVLNIFLRPGPKRGSPAQVYLDPIATPFQLSHRVKTGGRRLKINVQTQRLNKKPGSSEKTDVVRATGRIPLGFEEKVFYRKITHPDLWTGANLKAFLEQRGVQVQGRVQRGPTPSNARMVASSPGASMVQLVHLMMKHSNNFIAEMLAKQLALSNGAKVGRLNEGLKMIQSHIKSFGLDTKDFHVSNVAGLSRQNRFNVHTLAQLLQIYHNQFHYSYEFVSSLPISGQDGTLKSRMQNKNIRGKIRAKSGQINGVVGLAGYIQTKKEGVKVFVTIYNGKKENHKVISFIDELLLAILL